MKKMIYKAVFLLTIISLAYAISNIAAAQEPTVDTITILPRGGGYMLQYDLLRQDELGSLLKTNDEAYTLFKKGRSKKTTTLILSFTGGALIAFPLGQLIANADPYWWMMGAGGACFLVSIPFSDYQKEYNEAVHIYNEKLRGSPKPKTKLSLGIQQNGLGLVFKF